MLKRHLPAIWECTAVLLIWKEIGDWIYLILGLLDDKHFYHRVSAKHILDS